MNMFKKILGLILTCFITANLMGAYTPPITGQALIINTNGALVGSPNTNFFKTNIVLLAEANSTLGIITNGISAITVTNITQYIVGQSNAPSTLTNDSRSLNFSSVKNTYQGNNLSISNLFGYQFPLYGETILINDQLTFLDRQPTPFASYAFEEGSFQIGFGTATAIILDYDGSIAWALNNPSGQGTLDSDGSIEAANNVSAGVTGKFFGNAGGLTNVNAILATNVVSGIKITNATFSGTSATFTNPVGNTFTLFIGGGQSGGIGRSIASTPSGIVIEGVQLNGGVVSASGSGLTSLPAAQLTGIAPTNTVAALLPTSITGNAVTATGPPAVMQTATAAVPIVVASNTAGMFLTTSATVSNSIDIYIPGNIVVAGTFNGSAAGLTGLPASKIIGQTGTNNWTTFNAPQPGSFAMYSTTVASNVWSQSLLYSNHNLSILSNGVATVSISTNGNITALQFNGSGAGLDIPTARLNGLVNATNLGVISITNLPPGVITNNNVGTVNFGANISVIGDIKGNTIFTSNDIVIPSAKSIAFGNDAQHIGGVSMNQSGTYAQSLSFNIGAFQSGVGVSHITTFNVDATNMVGIKNITLASSLFVGNINATNLNVGTQQITNSLIVSLSGTAITNIQTLAFTPSVSSLLTLNSSSQVVAFTGVKTNKTSIVFRYPFDWPGGLMANGTVVSNDYVNVYYFNGSSGTASYSIAASLAITAIQNP